MSIFRQLDEGVLIRSFGLTFSQTEMSPPTSEEWNQLVYATKGVITVKTGEGTWVVPPHRAVWVPAGIRYRLQVTGGTSLRTLYLRKKQTRFGFDASSCAVVNVSPLLRELIVRAVGHSVLLNTVPSQKRLAAVIEDEIQVLGTVPLQLPMPRSEVAQRFALLAESKDVEAALRESGASRRTMERLFRSETGMSLGQWVRRRLLLSSLEGLAAGETTASVAFRLGYKGPSAFIAMFKRELGETPGAYVFGRDRV